MVSLVSLWIPILLSAIIVFMASSVMHMVLGHHKDDHAKLDAEPSVMDALRKFAIPPGDYFMPRPGGPKDMGSAEYKDKLDKGPVIIMTVLPNGRQEMAKNFALWLMYSVLVAVFAGYVTSHALQKGAAYLDVFCIVATVAFAGYSLALLQDSIWYHRKWSTTLKYAFDGLVYALLTAGTFGWLWPK